MSNPWHGENSQQLKTGKRRHFEPAPAAAPKFPVKNISWPALPKGRGPNRNPWGSARKAKIHPVSEGL